jgi:hypothetical protein
MRCQTQLFQSLACSASTAANDTPLRPHRGWAAAYDR